MQSDKERPYVKQEMVLLRTLDEVRELVSWTVWGNCSRLMNCQCKCPDARVGLGEFEQNQQSKRRVFGSGGKRDGRGKTVESFVKTVESMHFTWKWKAVVRFAEERHDQINVMK